MKLTKHKVVYVLTESDFEEYFNNIGDLRPLLLVHPDSEMVRAACLHYLGDKFQKFDKKQNIEL